MTVDATLVPPLFRWPGKTRITVLRTGPAGTPAPADLDQGEFSVESEIDAVVRDPVFDLVLEAQRYTAALAVLAIDPEDKETVEAVMARRPRRIKRRPLRKSE